MALEQTWRWFGPNDPIGLEEIRQTGATGIVTALHQIPPGEVWTKEAILERKQIIAAAGLTWSVVESLPVCEDIKKRAGNFKKAIENYRVSLCNLGACGIDTVCYNFMPVLDWSRTDVHVPFRDGSYAAGFDAVLFAAFDLFILKRPGAEGQYSPAMLEAARNRFAGLHADERKRLEQNILMGLPGSGDSYTLAQLQAALSSYEGIDAATLMKHLELFLQEVVPAAEAAGVRLAIHPDDPPWSLLGLPRIVTGADNIQKILSAVDSPANGLTLCTGSLGAGFRNDLVAIAERFAPRINFVHLRNVSRSPEGHFLEENHLEGDIDLYGVMKALLMEQRRRAETGRPDRRFPMRPDHGHLMLDDLRGRSYYPGYSLYGRLRGLAELRGLEVGVARSLGL